MSTQTSPKYRYDTERLMSLQIEDVLEDLGAERIGNSNRFKCFNKPGHKSDDKSASMMKHPSKNTCKCFGCGAGGGPIGVVMAKVGGDFIEACEWLHQAYNIPYLDGTETNASHTFSKPADKEIEYLRFDKERPFNHIVLDEWLPHYDRLNDEQKLKMVYTLIYRFSLQTDQQPKDIYHASRGISSNHPEVTKIGYLSAKDIRTLHELLGRTFPKEDLTKFNLFSSKDAEFYPESWKYWSKVGFCVAPSVDLYSDMCNGIMLRNTDANLDKKKPKEIQVSKPEISLPLPFGLTRELLLSDKVIPVFINEGYIDGLSLGADKSFIAATGVHGLKDRVIGLLEGREAYLAYDMDIPGIRAMQGYNSTTVKRLGETKKEKFVNHYFLNIPKDCTKKEKYERRIKKWTSASINNRFHPGLIEKMPLAGVKPVVISWDTKINSNKFVTDINDILKEYQKAYSMDLTGKTIEQAVHDLKIMSSPAQEMLLRHA